MTPLQSFAIKLALLAGVAGLVAWVGWPLEEPARPPATNEPAPLVAQGAIAESSLRAPSTSRPLRGAPQPTRRLDLNKASAEDLERLPGIGAVLARRMVDQRRAIGGFTTVDDLLAVKGIGRKRLEELRPLVTVQPSRQPASPTGGLPAVSPKDRL